MTGGNATRRGDKGTEEDCTGGHEIEGETSPQAVGERHVVSQVPTSSSSMLVTSLPCLSALPFLFPFH